MQVGDRVRSVGAFGKVVFVIERDEWSAAFPAAEWRYLGTGFIVLESDGTLIHYPTSDPCVRLAGRG